MNIKKLKMPKRMRLTTRFSSPSKLKVKGMNRKMAKSFKGIKNINVAAAKKLRRFKKLAKLKAGGTGGYNNNKAEAEAEGVAVAVAVAVAEVAAGRTTANATPASGRSIRTKWIAVVKNMSRPKFPRPRIPKGSSKTNNNNNNTKNIIIIHNNTSIASNDDFNRTSCVEMDIASLKAAADQQEIMTATDNASPADLKNDDHDDGDGDHHHDNQEEEMIADASLSSKEVDVTSIDSAAPPPPDQASKEDEDEEAEESDEEEEKEETEEHEAHRDQIKEAEISMETEANLEMIRLREEKAVIHIQSGFRAHLARRAYRALKSLVKLQAVVRGVCVRRQARIALHCMNSLARLQVKVRARQLLNSPTQ